MFLKGFICGWLGMAAIVAVLVWGMTPRVAKGAVDFGGAYFDGTSGDRLGDYRAC